MNINKQRLEQRLEDVRKYSNSLPVMTLYERLEHIVQWLTSESDNDIDHFIISVITAIKSKY